MDLPNPKGLFKPEMLASMTFESKPENGLIIPSTAVVEKTTRTMSSFRSRQTNSSYARSSLAKRLQIAESCFMVSLQKTKSF